MWWVPGRGGMAKAAAEQAARLGTVVPRKTIWKNRFLRISGIVTGTYLVFLSSLEIIRLQLPRDPWQEDAAAARRKAESANPGVKVSRWFGPKGYRAVEYAEWKRRVDARFETAQIAHQKMQVVHTGYTEMREHNRAIAKDILDNGFSDEVEKQKVKHSVFTDSESRNHPRPDQTKKEERDEDQIIEWNNMVPWDQLREETDIQIRLIPHTRGIGETIGSSDGNDDELDTQVTSVFVSIDDDEK